MIRPRLPAFELLIAVAVLTTAGPSSEAVAAERASLRANLRVIAPPGCATSGALEQRVRRRSERVRFVDPGPGVRLARAELLRVEGGVRATLAWRTEGGRELVRELHAPNCQDALDALAVVLAVALDPDAELGIDPVLEASPDQGMKSVAPLPATGGSARVDEASKSDESKPERRGAKVDGGAAEAAAPDNDEAADPGSLPSDEPGADRLRLSPFAGLAGGLRSGPSPMLLPGLGFFVGFGLNWGLPDAGLARLGWSRHRRNELEVDGGTAAFELDTLRLDVCPLGLFTGAFAWYGCFGAELGVLEAEGETNASTRSRERPWRSIGGALLVALHPHPRLEIQWLAAIERPLVRDRFEFRPRTFHEVSTLAARFELAAGIRIP